MGGRTASTFRRWKRGECRPHHTDFAKLLFGLFKERSGENPEALWLREAWEEWPRPVGRPAEGQPAISSEVPIDLERYRARTQAWCLVDVAMLETRGGIDRERPDIRLHEIFVPQDCLTERPPAGEDPAEPRSSRLPCLDAIALPEARLLVLLGEPGAGKSVLARYVALALLGHVPARDRGEWAKRLGGRVPFLVELRDYAAMEAEGRCRSLVDYLGQKGETEHYGFDAEQVRATLARLPTLLILDGLDEIFDPVRRERVTQQIVGLSVHGQARVLVTSRPAGFREHPYRAAGFAVATLQLLTEPQIERFAAAWFWLIYHRDPGQGERKRADLMRTLEERQELKELASNPMLLTVMALVLRHQPLASTRIGLYR